MANNSSQLIEGPHDPSIYRAIFLAGGPGSGKSYVAKNSGFESLGFKIVNNDIAFEKYLASDGLAPTPDNIYSARGQELRTRAKEITNKKMHLYLDGNLGLVIDGTGKDLDKIIRQANKLKALGYEVAMVFVNTDLDTALARNRKRKRTLPDDQVTLMWTEVQRNLGEFQHYFKSQMYLIDNSKDSNTTLQIHRLYVGIREWARGEG
jgi:predicted kinase